MEELHRLRFSSDDYTQFGRKWKRLLMNPDSRKLGIPRESEVRRKSRSSEDLDPDG